MCIVGCACTFGPEMPCLGMDIGGDEFDLIGQEKRNRSMMDDVSEVSFGIKSSKRTSPKEIELSPR